MLRRFRNLTLQSPFKPVPGGFEFHPHGVWGRGYIVDEARKAEIDRRLNRFYLWAVVLLMLLVLAALPFSVKILPQYPRLGALIAAVGVTAFGGLFVFAGYIWTMRRALAGLTPATARRTLGGVLSSRAASTSRFRLVFVLAGSLIMLATSALALRRGIAGGNVQVVVLSALGILLFASTAALNLHGLWLKRRLG
jgi:hypothetical protein